MILLSSTLFSGLSQADELLLDLDEQLFLPSELISMQQENSYRRMGDVDAQQEPRFGNMGASGRTYMDVSSKKHSSNGHQKGQHRGGKSLRGSGTPSSRYGQEYRSSSGQAKRAGRRYGS
jgi:hypothetical protein